MTMKTRLLTVTMSSALMSMMSGCAMTEVVEPASDTYREGRTITLTIANPDAENQTRAGNDHVLRYSALMYAGKQIDEKNAPERKEALASADGGATITFEVAEGDYTFVVIGDYIPMVAGDGGTMSEPEPGDNGLYADCYYDTHSDNARLYMLSFRDYKNNKNVDKKCVNNENYDCFAKKFTINKGVEEEKRDVSLDRVVSRVSFVSNTVMPEGATVTDISVSDFDFYPTLTYTDMTTGEHARGQSYKLPDFKITPVYPDGNGELFYFYTLASNKNISRGELYAMNITVSLSDGTKQEVRIPEGTIVPFANYKITVKAPFLSRKLIPSGNIILNLSTDSEEWNSRETTND